MRESASNESRFNPTHTRTLIINPPRKSSGAAISPSARPSESAATNSDNNVARVAGVTSVISPASDVDSFLTAFTPLVPFIQAFFNEVLVMDKDAALREARLALLQRVAGLAEGIVDLSKLEGF